MTTQIPFTEPGIPGYESQEFGQIEPRAGEGPFHTTNEPVGQSTTLSIYQVVGKDGSGNLVPADISDPDPANHIVAYGIMAISGVTAVGESLVLPVYRSGQFNMNALVWPASYDTDAKKKAAFEAGPSTAILIKSNPNDPTFT